MCTQRAEKLFVVIPSNCIGCMEKWNFSCTAWIWFMQVEIQDFSHILHSCKVYFYDMGMCKKVSKKTYEAIQGLGERLHCDETLLRTFQKGRFIYFWAVKCPVTKTIVEYHLSKHRTLEDANLLLWEVRRRFPTTYFPKVIRNGFYACVSLCNHEGIFSWSPAWESNFFQAWKQCNWEFLQVQAQISKIQDSWICKYIHWLLDFRIQ